MAILLGTWKTEVLGVLKAMEAQVKRFQRVRLFTTETEIVLVIHFQRMLPHSGLVLSIYLRH